ncbi:hypothetical protein J1614_010715 [Plenodomus biglobosus]|nr:hypothetical protein J1614_010715 [Plenodomus biglobosus]
MNEIRAKRSRISPDDLLTAVKMTSRLPIVSAINAAGFPKPPGTKFLTSRCVTPSVPKPCNAIGPSEGKYPVLLHNDYMYWPLSYKDDRFSFAIVRTSSTSAELLDILEIKGARYIDSIDVSPGNESISFIGQGYKVVSVRWNDLAAPADSSTSPLQLSSTSSAPFLGTSKLEDDLEVGTIVGIVLGSVLGVMITVVGSYLYRRMLQGKRRALSLPSPRRYSADELENGESNLEDRASLFDRDPSERSLLTRESHSPAIVSSPGRPSNILDYGTIRSSRTSPKMVRGDTWTSIGSNPPGFGLGEPGSD